MSSSSCTNNEASSSMKPKPRDFEFDFDWDCKNFEALGQTTKAQKNDLKDKIYNRRTSFGDRVATWATEVDTES